MKERIKVWFYLACAKNRITRGELADGVGVSRETVRRWLDFSRPNLPSLEALLWLVEVKNVNIDDLIGRGGAVE